MLYDEFIAGTGCRDNADNYKVYKDLEVLYMNSDLTKDEIYAYGKKLVNNALTEKQIEWNADIDRQIADLEKQVEYYQGEIKYNEDAIILWTGFDVEMVAGYKKSLKWAKNQLKYYKNSIKDLKTCKYV